MQRSIGRGQRDIIISYNECNASGAYRSGAAAEFGKIRDAACGMWGKSVLLTWQPGVSYRQSSVVVGGFFGRGVILGDRLLSFVK